MPRDRKLSSRLETLLDAIFEPHADRFSLYWEIAAELGPSANAAAQKKIRRLLEAKNEIGPGAAVLVACVLHLTGFPAQRIMHFLSLYLRGGISTSLFDFAVSFAMWVGFYVLERGAPLASWLFLPLLLLPILLFALGTTWLLSSLGVFLRDLPQLVGVVTTMLLFLSPIFYPATRIPAWAAPYYHLNPFVGILEAARGSLFFGTPPDGRSLALLTAAGWAVAWLGYAWFMRTKPGFADVL